MPVYEYSCEAGHRFEVKQKFSDAPITKCQVCALPVTKLISAPAISFKGTGWYLTDYSEKLKPPATEEKTTATASTEKKDAAAETSPSKESKPAAPTPSTEPKTSAPQISQDGSKTAGSSTGS